MRVSGFFVGLDVHKDTIAVAVAEAGRAPARLVGGIAHDVGKLLKVLAHYGEPGWVQVVYEAGPTGYGLQRELARRGYHCQVIAPSLIPKRARDRVKTDRRDGLRWPSSRAGGSCARCGFRIRPTRRFATWPVRARTR
jgi:transposase